MKRTIDIALLLIARLFQSFKYKLDEVIVVAGVIYLQQEDGTLMEMTENVYDREDDLQELLENYPDLIPGDQISLETPRKWILVKREAGIPSEDNGSDRWFLDHLFLDQDGIPTLIEAKRSCNPEIRRQIVGQMIEYASNFTSHWTLEMIKANVELLHGGVEHILEESLSEIFDLEEVFSLENYWLNVDKNLQAGKIRMIFIADRIPSELRTMVEFLNSQMNPAEVFAVEVPQYTGEGLRVLAPRLIGQTMRSKAKKQYSRANVRWDETSFFEAAKKSLPVETEYHSLRMLYEECKQMGCSFTWGTGKIDGSFSVKFPGVSKNTIISVYSQGNLQFAFEAFKKTPAQAEFRDELKKKVEEEMGLVFAEDYQIKYPLFNKNYWITQVPDLLNIIGKMKEEYIETID